MMNFLRAFGTALLDAFFPKNPETGLRFEGDLPGQEPLPCFVRHDFYRAGSYTDSVGIEHVRYDCKRCPYQEWRMES